MKFFDIEQNTEAWLDLRVGNIGGSSIGTIMANFGKPFGDPAHKLAVNIAIERITGKRLGDNYMNEHMQRGHEQEPIARALYEQTNFCEVANGGYFLDGHNGVSPDGLVYDDGMIEIKSVIAPVHFKTISRDKFDPSYKWQLFFNLKTAGREWIDFVSFCSEFPEGKRLFEDRVYKDGCTETFKMIDERLAEFEDLITDKISTINKVTE